MKRVNNNSRGAGGGVATLLFFCAAACLLIGVATATVRQDDSSRRLVKRDLSSQSKDDSGKMKKLYSNKEIVAFDDDEDQQPSAAAAAAAAPAPVPILAESPSMSPKDSGPVLSRSQRTDTHAAFKNKKTASSSSNGISDDMIDSLLAELSASAANKRGGGYNGNRYGVSSNRKKPTAYEIIWDYFDEEQQKQDDQPLLSDDELIELEAEDEMKANEVGQSIGGGRVASGYKPPLRPQHLSIDETADMFGGGGRGSGRQQWVDVKTDDEDDEDDDEEPVKTVEVKEKVLLENEYNNELKSHAPNKPEKSGDQLYTSGQILSMDVNGQQQPSMIKQNGAVSHEVDPNLSSQIDSLKQQNDHLFTFVLAGCILAGVVALVAAGVCWYTVHRNYKASEAEYGVKIGKFNSGSGSKGGSVKSTSSSSGDRRLAQSAQMYHYQHQKQQMIAMEKANNDTKPDNSDNSEGEAEEGDYTVYECPGLAPTGEMVVKNPLFKEDFSQSLHNINSHAASSNVATAATATTANTTTPPPPAYATLTPIGEASPQQLIQLDPSAAASTAAEAVQQAETTRVESINEVVESRSNNASTNNLAAQQQQQPQQQ